jgi:hypothetical protein
MESDRFEVLNRKGIPFSMRERLGFAKPRAVHRFCQTWQWSRVNNTVFHMVISGS